MQTPTPGQLLLDQRDLGMTWSPLGMANAPTDLTVHARLRRHG
jgi:hypothetical protein